MFKNRGHSIDDFRCHLNEVNWWFYYPKVDNRKIIASSGTREGGLVQTGIIAMNTAGQEIFYTDNARKINFRGNAVIDGVCAPASHKWGDGWRDTNR